MVSITPIAKGVETGKKSIDAVMNTYIPDSINTDIETVQQPQEIKPIESSIEWYDKLQGKILTPEQKEYFFNNTKDIIEPLGIVLTDDDIRNYINRNNIKDLDNMIVSTYNKKGDEEALAGLQEVVSTHPRTFEWRLEEMEKLQKRIQERPIVSLEDIANIRSKLISEVASKKEPANISPVVKKEVAKSNRLSQSLNKLAKQREERPFTDGVADITEQIAIGGTFFRTIMTNERLMSMPGVREALNPWMRDAQKWINKEASEDWWDRTKEAVQGVTALAIGSAKELYYSVMRGSNLERLSEAINNLPEDSFNAVMDFIDTDPFLNQNLLFKQELLSALSGYSGVQSSVTNVAEVLNTVSTPKQIGEAFNKGIKGTKVAKGEPYIPPEPSKRPPMAPKDFIDIDYTKVVTEAAKKNLPKAEEAIEKLQIKEIASPTSRFRKVMGYTESKEGELYTNYRYYDSIEEVLEDIKKDPKAVFQRVPDTDKTASGKVVYRKSYEDSLKIHKGEYPEFTAADLLEGQVIRTDTPMQAASRAYAAGENIQGDLNAGATQLANEKLVTKIKNGEQLTKTETYAVTPDLSSGAKRNTLPATKAVDIAELEKETNALMSQAEVEKMTGKIWSSKDFDPEAFQRLESGVKHDYELRLDAIKKNNLDLRYSNQKIVSSEGGIEVEEIFGFGPGNNSPIKGLTPEKVEALIKEGDFITAEINGQTVLAKRFFLPYNSQVATKITDDKVGTFTPYLFSIKSSGIEEASSSVTYLARGKQGGIRGMLTNFVSQPIKKLDKKSRAVLDSIYNEEWMNNRLLTKDEVYLRCGGENFEALWDAVEASRKLEAISEFFDNRQVRSFALRNNYKQYFLGDAIKPGTEDLRYPFIAKKLDKPDLSDIQKAFYEYFDQGSEAGVIMKPSEQLPFKSLDDVDVYRLFTPINSNKYDVVEYVIVPKKFAGIQEGALPTRMLGRRVHAGTNYADKYFISFPRLAKNSDDKYVSYLKTVFTASTRKEAESTLEKMQEILDVMGQVKKELISAEEADGLIEEIALRGKYPLSGDFSTYEGWAEFLKKYKAEDLMNEYQYSKLSIRKDAYSPFASVQIPGSPNDTVTVGNIMNRYHKGDNPILNPVYSSHAVNTVNVDEYMNRLINKASTNASVNVVLETEAERFLATYGHLIDPKNPPKSAIDYFKNFRKYVDPLAVRSAESKFHEASVYSDMMLRALGQNNLDTWSNRIIDRFLTKLTMSENRGVSSLGEALMDKHPVARLQNWAYKTIFSFRLDQFAIQAALTSIESAGAFPGDTARAGSVFYPIMDLINDLNRGVDIDDWAKVLEQVPAIRKYWPEVTAEDLKVLTKYLWEQGVTATYFNDIRANSVMLKSSNLTMAPFNKGNAVSRTLGYLTAASHRSREMKKAISEFDTKDFAWVAMTGDALSGGSSAANVRLPLSLSLTKPFAMMTSFPLNQMETFIMGSTVGLTKGQRAQWLATMVALFGTQTFVDSRKAREVSLWLEDQAGSKELADLAALGVLNYILNEATGRDWDIGQFTPELVKNIYFDAFNMVMSDDADVSPFIVNMLQLTGMRASEAMEYFQDPEEGLPGFREMSGTDKAQAIAHTLISVSPGLAQADKLWAAVKFDEYRNRKGIDLIAPHGNREGVTSAVLMETLLGVKDADLSQLKKYAVEDYKKSVTEDYNNAKKLATKWNIDGFSKLARGEVEEANKSFLRANHFLELGCQDLTPYQKQRLQQEVLKNSMNGVSASERKLLVDRSNPSYLNYESLQRYFNNELQTEYLRNNQNKTKEAPVEQDKNYGLPFTPAGL